MFWIKIIRAINVFVKDRNYAVIVNFFGNYDYHSILKKLRLKFRYSSLISVLDNLFKYWNFKISSPYESFKKEYAFHTFRELFYLFRTKIMSTTQYNKIQEYIETNTKIELCHWTKTSKILKTWKSAAPQHNVNSRKNEQSNRNLPVSKTCCLLDDQNHNDLFTKFSPIYTVLHTQGVTVNFILSYATIPRNKNS